MTSTGMASNLIMGGVGLLSKAFLQLCVQMQVRNLPILLDAIHRRPAGVPLLTVSNHTSTLDDPVLFGILPAKTLFNAARMRWVLGADELLFTNPIFSAFFLQGRVLGVRRGDGVMQPSVTRAVQLMNEGEWIHTFPEGRVIPDSSGLKTRLKWGIGRLILESAHPPILLPIIHQGFEYIKPFDSWLPRPGRPLWITIGTPIDTSQFRAKMASSTLNVHQRRSQTAALVAAEMSKYYQINWSPPRAS